MRRKSGAEYRVAIFFVREERKQAAAKQTLTELEERRMTIDECQLYVPSVNEIETEVAKRRACEASGFYE